MAQELSAEEQIEALEALGFTIEDEDDPNSPVSDVDAELEALGFEIGNEEVPDPAPEPEVLDAISTQMYAGMTFADAQQRYDDITSGPNVTNPIMGLGYAVYKDPETGRREFIPRPLRKSSDAVTAHLQIVCLPLVVLRLSILLFDGLLAYHSLQLAPSPSRVHIAPGSD